jgi:epoxide hydrolase-like protein
VRSREKNALPLLITQGWPGSVFEQIKLIAEQPGKEKGDSHEHA